MLTSPCLREMAVKSGTDHCCATKMLTVVAVIQNTKMLTCGVDRRRSISTRPHGPIRRALTERPVRPNPIRFHLIPNYKFVVDVLIRVLKQRVVRGYQCCVNSNSAYVEDISARKEAWALGPVEGRVASSGDVTTAQELVGGEGRVKQQAGLTDQSGDENDLGWTRSIVSLRGIPKH